jgi:hypothetical protein
MATGNVTATITRNASVVADVGDKAPTVSLVTLTDPSPGVQITVTALASSAYTISVWRTDSTGTYEVRGAVNTPVVGSFTVNDFEVPLGTTVTYTAATTDFDGFQSGTSTGVAITLNSTRAWLTDPIIPTTALMVRIADVGERSRDIDSASYSIVGTDAPSFVGGTRQSGQGSITFNTLTLQEAQDLRALMSGSPVLLLRAPYDTWDIGTIHLGFGKVTEQRLSRSIVEPVRNLVCDVVYAQRPSPIIPGPNHTWQELADKGYTWRNLSDPNLTWLQCAQRGGT